MIFWTVKYTNEKYKYTGDEIVITKSETMNHWPTDWLLHSTTRFIHKEIPREAARSIISWIPSLCVPSQGKQQNSALQVLRGRLQLWRGAWEPQSSWLREAIRMQDLQCGLFRLWWKMEAWNPIPSIIFIMFAFVTLVTKFCKMV